MTKDQIISDAVRYSQSGNGTLAQYWHYYTNSDMRAKFANRAAFLAECREYELMWC